MFNESALTGEMESLKKFALKLTRNSDDADDLVQSTALRALEKADLFEDGTNMFSWTSKIMYNMFVSEYRRKSRFETQYDPEQYIEKKSTPATQEVQMEFSQVQEAMEILSEDHRNILIMVCVKGMQYAEVAKCLNIPVGTVRSRLFRARESLQCLLDDKSSALSPWPAVKSAAQSGALR